MVERDTNICRSHTRCNGIYTTEDICKEEEECYRLFSNYVRVLIAFSD